MLYYFIPLSLENMPTPKKYAHPPFSQKVIAKGDLLLKSMPTQHTKIIGSSMRNDEICSVCAGLLYFVLRVQCDKKQTHLSSS